MVFFHTLMAVILVKSIKDVGHMTIVYHMIFTIEYIGIGNKHCGITFK